MPIPEERLPEADESYVEQPETEQPNTVDSLQNNDELEFESSAADESDDEELNEGSEADTAGFGFGEPAD